MAIAIVCAIVFACAIIGTLGWRALDLRARSQVSDRTMKEKELALKERELAISERRAPALAAPDPTTFPRALMQMANSESEEWARDDAQALIAEAYLETGGDWTRATAYVGTRMSTQRDSRLPKHLLS